MSFVFNVKAQTVPAILIVVGAFLMVTGQSMGDAWLSSAGWACVMLGAIIEVIYVLAECLPKIL